MTAFLWGAVVLAGTTALIAPLGLRPLLTRLGVLDVPNERSSHTKPTLRAGGVAPLLGIVLGTVLAIILMPRADALSLGLVAAAAVATSLVGLAEDIRGLPVAARVRLQLLLGAALAVAFSAAAGAGWVWVPLAALFFAAHVNFTNFMDGVNAISALHGLVAGLAYAALGAASQQPWLVVLGLIIAATFLTFLPWNVRPPGVFLGDVGSYLLGGALGAAAIAAMFNGLHPLAALAPLVVYWADTVSILIRRALRSEPVFEAHRTHVYQRLTNAGLSHLASAITVAAFTLATSAVGLLTATSTISWPWGVALIAGLVAGYLALPGLLGDVLPPIASNELQPVTMPDAWPAREGWAPKRWGVLGASGFIGSAIAEHLVSAGADALRLAAPRLELDPRVTSGSDIAAIASGLAETDHLAGALRGIDVLVNAAGMATPDGSGGARIYGANSLLPAVVAVAARRAGVGRVIHLSSAAVQGSRPVLDTSMEIAPFSPYSRSKALGERAVLALVGRNVADPQPEVVIIRATSVQGPGRPTTESLRRIANSPLASVAAPGSQPTVVSSLDGLVEMVEGVGLSIGVLPPIVLQPWEGLSVSEVLQVAGGRRPMILPRWFCKVVVRLGRVAGRFIPKVSGVTRRVEMMWFGQSQEVPTMTCFNAPDSGRVRAILQGSGLPS